MPAIHLFQRRTLYGGDDLHVVALVTAMVRLLQLVCYSVLAYHIVHHVVVSHSASSTSSNDDFTTGQQQQQQHHHRSLTYYDREATSHNNYQYHYSMPLGISLLEYGWMDEAVHHDERSLQQDDDNDDNTNESSCEDSRLFPLILTSYTVAGVVFGVVSILLLARIYHVSSQGSPTIHRHPRTERMEQLLEWLFLPLNVMHGFVWAVGLWGMVLASYYEPCVPLITPSTLYTVLWIACYVMLLVSQAIEIIWNFLYLFVLYYHDPHALLWTPSNSTTTSRNYYSSYHSSNNLQIGGIPSTSTTITTPQQDQTTSSTTTRMALQPPIQYDHYDNHDLIEQMWAERCQNCCRILGSGTCYIFGGKELYGQSSMHYGDFARAMADYLETRGVLDVVPSDIIVGFLVLQQLQIQRRHVQRQEVRSEIQSSAYFTTTTTSISSTAIILDTSSSAKADGVFATTSSHHQHQQQSTNTKTQLHNHRADANGNSPNGMRLPKSTSFNDILLPTPEDLFQSTTTGPTTSSKAAKDTSHESSLQQQQQPTNAIKMRVNNPSVLLQSLGAGSIPSMDAASLGLLNNSDNDTGNANNINRGVFLDHSSPPPPKLKSFRRQHSNTNSSASSLLLSSLHNQQDGPSTANKSFQRLLSEQNHADVMTLQDGARYSKYALAIYTWYLYLYVHPITGIPRLCAKAWNAKCSCCLSQDTTTTTNNDDSIPSSNTLNSNHNGASSRGEHHTANPRLHRNQHTSRRWEGDNICQAHKHALLLTAGLENEADLVYVQFKSTFSENPYCILLDHEAQAVVVAVRGTFSLEDCITDVLIEPEPLEALGDEFGFAHLANGQHCHGGVLASARNVYRDLKRHGSLEYLLGTKYPHYQLKLVGHSLGGATSTLLGFMLRQQYPTLQCFNYSPPGCTLTWDMATQCQSWCTSFVLDAEVVPRLSFEALEYLRDEVLDLIGRIRVSKIEVARRVATKTLWCRNKYKAGSRHDRARYDEYDVEQGTTSVDELDELLNDLLIPLNDVPTTPEATSYRQQLDQFQSIQSERRSTRGLRRTVRLFPPGRILHLVKTDEEDSCMVHVTKCMTCCMSNAGSLYTPVWIGNGDLDEIVISPTMGTDHFPDRMVVELNGIVQNFGLTQPYRR
jgi:Lipase (class 3)